MTDGTLIAAIGAALFGERWKADLARELDVSRDTVDDWSKGRMRPRPGVWADLEKLVAQRQAELAKLPAAIVKASADAKARASS